MILRSVFSVGLKLNREVLSLEFCQPFDLTGFDVQDDLLLGEVVNIALYYRLFRSDGMSPPL